jgi:predicted DNA-binding protein (MmcQ/YjbR family)
MTTLRNVMARPRDLRKQLIDYALSKPETYLDHPWGEDVVKVNKKVCVFFGIADNPQYPPGMTVKLSDSHPLAVAQPGVQPSGYNLGKSGWVSVRFSDELPVEMLREWIDESYRAVAPKRLLGPRVTKSG